MPLYIAPSFLKLFLLLYSGLGEVEGRERNRKGKFNQTTSTSSGAVPVAGPVLKPQHLECKMQFHSAAAPSEQGRGRAAPAGAAPLASTGQQEPCWALGSPRAGRAVLLCPALPGAEMPGLALARLGPVGLKCCSGGLGCVGRTGTGRQHCTKQPVLLLGVIPNY